MEIRASLEIYGDGPERKKLENVRQRKAFRKINKLQRKPTIRGIKRSLSKSPFRDPPFKV